MQIEQHFIPNLTMSLIKNLDPWSAREISALSSQDPYTNLVGSSVGGSLAKPLSDALAM
jgi:hypothetical protein